MEPNKKKQNHLTIGYAKFKKNSQKKMKVLLQKILQKDKEKNGINRVLQQLIWFISKKWFLSQKWDQIFSLIDQADCQKLHIQRTFYPKILISLCQPFYTKISCLVLVYNNLQNIQCLTFINFRSLKRLKIYQNNITSMKSLNKMYSPKLSQFLIFTNPVKQLDLSRIQLISDEIDVQIEDAYGPMVLAQDFNIFAKLQSEKIDQFWMCQIHRYRIHQQKIKQAFIKRYEHCSLTYTKKRTS